MPTFPILSQGQDSSMFEVTNEDPSVRTEMEGGYVVSRPRHTRTPRKTYKTGFSRLTQADRVALDAFWNEVKGGSLIFDWTDPVTLGVVQVRFKGEITYKYTGVGGVHHWTVSMTLEQA